MGNKRIALAILAIGVVLAATVLFIDVLRGKLIEIGTVQLAIAGVCLLFSLIAGWYLWPASFQAGSRWAFYISTVPAAVGLLLLAINLLGLGFSLRNPKADEGFRHAGKFRVAQGQDAEVLNDIKRKAGETNPDYARRLTSVVYESVIHYWEEDGNQDLRVPIWENWLLWLNGTNPYEFCDPAKAIERRVGVCSQVSKILVSVIQEDGGFGAIYPYILDGHVVAQVLVDIDASGNETWWVLDSDYGLVIEHSVGYIEQHPETVHAAYLDAGYDEDISNLLTGIYGPEGNYEEGNVGICREEAQAYTDKWVLPLWMIAPALVLYPTSRILSKFQSTKTKR